MSPRPNEGSFQLCLSRGRSCQAFFTWHSASLATLSMVEASALSTAFAVFVAGTEAKRHPAHVVTTDKSYNFEEDGRENCHICAGMYRIKVEQCVRFQSQRI